jgi:hypothetical protein
MTKSWQAAASWSWYELVTQRASSHNGMGAVPLQIVCRREPKLDLVQCLIACFTACDWLKAIHKSLRDLRFSTQVQ